MSQNIPILMSTICHQVNFLEGKCLSSFSQYAFVAFISGSIGINVKNEINQYGSGNLHKIERIKYVIPISFGLQEVNSSFDTFFSAKKFLRYFVILPAKRGAKNARQKG